MPDLPDAQDAPLADRPARRMPPLLPSLVSLTRIPLAAAFIAIPDPLTRVVILGAAAASDFLDGRLARSLGQGTRLGELVDPIADKLFALATIAAFVLEGALQPWEVGVLLARDIATTLGFFIALAIDAPIRFKARMSGKVTTVFQIGVVLGLTLRSAYVPLLLGLTAAASLWAIADYARFGALSLRHAAMAKDAMRPQSPNEPGNTN